MSKDVIEKIENYFFNYNNCFIPSRSYRWLNKNDSRFLEFIYKQTEFLDSWYNEIKLSQRLWHIYYQIYDIQSCDYCGNPTKYINFRNGYNYTCSKKCTGRSEGVKKRKQSTKLKNFGNGDKNFNNTLKNQETKWKNRLGIDINVQKITNDTEFLDDFFTEVKFAQRVWHWYHNRGIQRCSECNNVVNFINFNQGYCKYCSFKCRSNSEEWEEKRRNTSLEKFGTWFFSQTSVYKDNRKSPKKKVHIYKLPSGKEIKLQGYEPWALDILLRTFDENEIVYNSKDMPEIWYMWQDGSWHRYHPDFYIPKNNLIIEVKSIYTYTEDFIKNKLKEEAVKYLGYNFKFMTIYKGDVDMKFKQWLNEQSDYDSLTDEEMLREAIYEEYRAANIYEKLARKAQSQEVKRVLLHVAKEEKAHIGEFNALLEKLDPEHEEMEEEGEEEVKDMGIHLPED